jgi:uncharacterized glyoxalase superfamily protein PhnB
MAVKPVPDGYHTVTPYLAVKGAAQLIDFVASVFGGELTLRMGPPDRVAHAEMRVGDSMLMLGDAPDEPSPAALYVFVEDADAIYRRALDAGATSLREPETMFYGDRSAGVKDAWGNTWWIATHVEDVPPEELKRRAAAQATA